MMPPGLQRQKTWKVRHVTDEKAAIKATLDAGAGLNHKKRMQLALQGIRDHRNDDSPEGRLRCFIYIVSALVQQQRAPSLTPHEIDDLVHSAYGILQIQGIQPGVSQLSFLYGEVHQATSLIYRKEGLPWRSAWEQQLGVSASRPNPLGNEGYQALSFANRALRLGHGNIAYHGFCEAEALESDALLRYQARIGRIQCLRLKSERDAAQSLLAESLANPDLPSSARRELNWEDTCLSLMFDGDWARMRNTVKIRREHAYATFMTEAFLWSVAAQSTAYRDQIPKMSTIARNSSLRPTQLGFLFTACRTLEDCYDSSIPLALRLKKLGNTLSQTSHLLTVDKELLLWAAAARWLARIHSFQLAALALREYESLSNRLSDARTSDCLRWAGDMLQSDWYTAINKPIVV